MRFDTLRKHRASNIGSDGSLAQTVRRPFSGARARNLLVLAAGAALAGALSPKLAMAQFLTWDPAENGSGSGGTGTWDTSTPEWYNGADVTWPDNSGSQVSTAVFGGTGGNVTIQSAGIYANGVTFNASGYVLGGGTLNLGGTTPTITANANATINSVIAGNAGLVTTGSGILTLTQSNTFSGTTTVSGGTLQLTNAGAVPGSITLAGGAVNFNFGGFASYNHDIILTANSTIGNSGNQINEFGTIYGNGNVLTVNSGGSSNFFFNGTYGSAFSQIDVVAGNIDEDGPRENAGMPLQNSPIVISSGASFGTYTNPTVNNNITLNGGAGQNNNGAIQNQGQGTPIYTGTITLNSGNSSIGTGGGTIIFNGNVTGGGGLTVIGGNLLQLSGQNTYAGPTTITNSTLEIGNGTSGSLSPNTAIADNGALILNVSGNLTQGTNFSSASITGTGTLTQAGTGTTVLTQANGYTGNTTVSAGRLVFQNGTNSGNIFISAGAVNEFNVSGTLYNPNNTTFKGNGTLQKTGGGLLEWPGTAATFALGSGSLIDVEGGTFIGGSNGNEVWTNNLSGLNVAAGAAFNGVEANVRVDALTGLGKVTSGYNGRNGSLTIGDNNGSGVFLGTLADSGQAGGLLTLFKAGTGTQTLSGANTYTGGTTVSGGTLIAAGGAPVAGTSSAIGNGGNLTVLGNATFAYEPSAVGQLSVGTLSLAGNSTIGTAAGGNFTGSSIVTAAAASATGLITVNVYGVTGGITAGTGTYTLISAASGLGSTSNYTLGTIYNPTNFTVSAGTLASNDTTLTIGLIANGAGTPSTTEYWNGGYAPAPTVWAASDGNSTSNWVTNPIASGNATPYTPGNSTTVIFSATPPATPATSTTLGATTSVLGIVVNDANGVGLNADGNILTIGSGGITVNSGAGAVSLAAPITLANNQTWTNSSGNALTASGALVNGGNTLTTTGGGATNLSGTIAGNGGLIVNGGVTTISAAASYTGQTNVNNGGSLTVSSTGSISSNNTLTVNNGGTFTLASGGSIAIHTMNDVGTSMVNNIAGNITTSGTQNYIDGITTQIAGTVQYADAELATSGGASGTYYLGGTGALTVTRGNYNSLDIGQRGTGNFYVSQGGALTNSGSALVIGQAYSGGNGAANGTLIQQGGTVTASGNTNNLAGVDLGAQANGNNASQNSAGIYELNGGTLTTSGISYGLSSHNVGSQFVFGGGTLTSSTAFTVAAVASTEATTTINSGGAFIDTTGGNITWNGNITAGAVGTAGFTGLAGGSGYTSAPAVSVTGGGGTGATAVAELNQSGNVFDVVITNPGSGYTSAPTFGFTGGGGSGASATGTFNTAVGGLTKIGVNTLTLAGANTFAGVTTVSAGTLALSTSSTNNIASSPAIVVASGATLDVTAVTGGSGFALNGASPSQVLGGTGTVNGNVTVPAGAILSAGTSIALGTGTANANGTLTNTGNQTWQAGGKYSAKITDSTGTQAPGTGSDLVTMVGLSVSGTSSGSLSTAFNVDPVGTLTGVAVGTTWTLAQTTGSRVLVNGNADDGTTVANAPNLLTDGSNAFALDTSNFSVNGSGLGINPQAFSLELVQSGSGDLLDLTYNSTPEPGTMLLVLAGAMPALAARRRRARSAK